MLNALFPVLYMIFGVLSKEPKPYTKILIWISNGFFYCCALSLVVSCLILLNALYQISTHLKELAHFAINKPAVTAHAVAFVTMIIGLVSSNIFMIVGGGLNVTN